MAHETNSRIENPQKLVIVGDATCGKTCLLYAFTHDTFDPKCPPIICENQIKAVQVDERRITLALFDTSGLEDYDQLRSVLYRYTNIVLICFSIDSSVSAINTIEKWMPEVQHFCGPCPVILVGCKKDLRTDIQTITKLKHEGEKPMTIEAGKQLATQIKADAYMECSAKTHEGIHELFLLAARLSFKKRNNKNKVKCNLL
ncbi:unnamed protein product [Adineta steineri]|uniref:Uncharacterized protein n=1 Tax=Adineta steineri TaxID=433720 RepID=A0A818XRL3_9BILA|nr:unnamed protein product [Adineta steineri]CAF3740562.1 unnamed protein product [Adineta steineri]